MDTIHGIFPCIHVTSFSHAMLVIVYNCIAYDHAQDLHTSKYTYDGYLRIMFKTTIPEVGSTVASSSLADTADNGVFCGDFFHRKLRNGDFERDLSLLRSLTNWLREATFSKYTHKQKYFYKTSKLKNNRHRT